jgi:sucrose-6-phosphate hydrolase SacC (GH32 family)
MMRWSHLPIALHPDEKGYILSGSAVVDRGNASGLGNEIMPPLVALFTYHDMAKEKADAKDIETQGLANSTDRGRTWTKCDSNPVLGNVRPDRDLRDPKVFRDEARNRFAMALAVGDHVEFYASETLKSWTYLSSFGGDLGARGGIWECPDLFPIRVAETARRNGRCRSASIRAARKAALARSILSANLTEPRSRSIPLSAPM